MGDGAHILGHHVASALDERVGACGLGKIDGSSRRAAESDELAQLLQTVAVGIAGGEHDVSNVLLNLLVDVHLLHHLACVENLLSRGHGAHRGQSADDVLADDELLLFECGIVNDHLQHEAVHLSLGQLIGTLLLDGVLGCHHEEWTGQLESVAADGHLMFLHGLEQCALHLSGCAVDFVGQHEVGKHGSFVHMEVLVLLRIDHRSDDVGRKQVGGELYAVVVSVDQLCQRLDGKRLGEARHTLEKDVAIAQQADEQGVNKMFLTYDNLVHAMGQIRHESALLLYSDVQFSDINSFCHNVVFWYLFKNLTQKYNK